MAAVMDSLWVDTMTECMLGGEKRDGSLSGQQLLIGLTLCGA